MTISTQVAVLGAGPGGYTAAFAAADHGLEVTLIDLEPNPGGTCLYRGCIPSKALLHAARVLTEAEEAKHFGIHFAAPRIDLGRLRKATGEVVDKLTGGLGQLSKARKINFIQGRGSFEDSNTLRVHKVDGTEVEVKFQHCIVAAGSRPSTLPKLDIESPRVMNSTDALELENIPKTLLVIGGGYIGLEMATVYAGLGSAVTIVEFFPTLLPGADPDLVKPLAASMATRCRAIHLGTEVVGMATAKNGIKVTLKGKDIEKPEQTFEKVLVCVGRKPNSSGLGLGHTGVKIDERGFVQVDSQMRTADPAIFAIGDLVGQPMLAHKASHEGRVAAEVIAGKNVVFDPKAIPAVVFTDPELAWCGLTETDAKKQGIPVEIARMSWAGLSRATTLNRNDGLTKILTDPETGRILGIGVVGAGAGELIAEGALAMEMGALASDLHLTIHPHPTLSESIMETAELIYGSSTHMVRPKKKA